jgi:hypothetical protein
MMRQWKPAKQRRAIPGAGLIQSVRIGRRTFSYIFLAVCVWIVPGFATAQASTPGATRTSLSVAVQRSGADTQTVFTAHVAGATGSALSEEGGAGAVSFETGSGSLGSAMVDEHGDATLSVSSLPLGAERAKLAVHAVYHPAADADGVTRTAASVSADASVEPDVSSVPDFAITANPATLTVKQGQYVTTAITITPSNGFSEQVTLSCANLAAQVTCNFSPVIASTANGAFTSTLEIQTQTASGALRLPDFGRGTHTALAWVLPGMLALAGFACRRHRAPGAARVLLLLLAVGGVLGLSACSARYGYIHHPPLQTTGTPLGTDTITINAAGNDGSAVTTHSISLVLQVQ